METENNHGKLFVDEPPFGALVIRPYQARLGGHNVAFTTHFGSDGTPKYYRLLKTTTAGWYAEIGPFASLREAVEAGFGRSIDWSLTPGPATNP